MESHESSHGSPRKKASPNALSRCGTTDTPCRKRTYNLMIKSQLRHSATVPVTLLGPTTAATALDSVSGSEFHEKSHGRPGLMGDFESKVGPLSQTTTSVNSRSASATVHDNARDCAAAVTCAVTCGAARNRAPLATLTSRVAA